MRFKIRAFEMHALKVFSSAKLYKKMFICIWYNYTLTVKLQKTYLLFAVFQNLRTHFISLVENDIIA